MWEDTGKDLVRELINLKFRIHDKFPTQTWEKLSTELDIAVGTALTQALNFDLLDEYDKMNKLFDDYTNNSNGTK